MGAVYTPNILRDGAAIADATIVANFVRKTAFTNGNVGAENFKPDAGIGEEFVQHPVNRCFAVFNLNSIACTAGTSTAWVIGEMQAPAFVAGHPTAYKLQAIHGRVLTRDAAFAATDRIRLQVRLWKKNASAWMGLAETGVITTVFDTDAAGLVADTNYKYTTNLGATGEKISQDTYPRIQALINITADAAGAVTPTGIMVAFEYIVTKVP